MSDRRSLQHRAVSRLLALPEPILAKVIGAPPIEIDSRVLNRSLQAMLAVLERLGLDERDREDLVARRQQFLQVTSLAMPVRRGIYVTDHYASGPEGPLPVRIYRRPGHVDAMPAIVYLHGGGWVTGDLDSHDATCRILADESDCVVVAVDYRLAPEHPFPAAVEDAAAAYRWVHDHSAELSIEAGRVGVMGDSAGGNLAAVVAQVQRDSDVPAPIAQILVYPSTDAHLRAPSHSLFAEGFMLGHDDIVWYREQYLPDPADWDSPLASPLLTDDLTGVCPALIVTAGFDPLRDEARQYADRLADAGVPVRYRCYDDMIHGFFGMGMLPVGLDLITEICRGAGDLMHDLV